MIKTSVVAYTTIKQNNCKWDISWPKSECHDNDLWLNRLKGKSNCHGDYYEKECENNFMIMWQSNFDWFFMEGLCISVKENQPSQE